MSCGKKGGDWGEGVAEKQTAVNEWTKDAKVRPTLAHTSTMAECSEPALPHGYC